MKSAPTAAGDTPGFSTLTGGGAVTASDQGFASVPHYFLEDDSSIAALSDTTIADLASAIRQVAKRPWSKRHHCTTCHAAPGKPCRAIGDQGVGRASLADVTRWAHGCRSHRSRVPFSVFCNPDVCELSEVQKDGWPNFLATRPWVAQ